MLFLAQPFHTSSSLLPPVNIDPSFRVCSCDDAKRVHPLACAETVSTCRHILCHVQDCVNSPPSAPSAVPFHAREKEVQPPRHKLQSEAAPSKRWPGVPCIYPSRGPTVQGGEAIYLPADFLEEGLTRVCWNECLWDKKSSWKRNSLSTTSPTHFPHNLESVSFCHCLSCPLVRFGRRKRTSSVGILCAMRHAQFKMELGSKLPAPHHVLPRHCSQACVSIGDSGFVMVVSTSSQTRPAQPRDAVHRGHLERAGEAQDGADW